MRRLSSQPHPYHCGRLPGRMWDCRRGSAGVNDCLLHREAGRELPELGPGKGVKFHINTSAM